MSEEDKVFHEILKELVATNQDIEERLNKFNKNQLEAFTEISNQNLEQTIVLQQMAEYLKNPQTIIDYVVKDCTKQNEKAIRYLTKQFKKTCLLFNPEIVGVNRTNIRIISSPSDPVCVNQNTTLANPVYSVNSTDLIQYAENAFLQVYNTAYYRVGYLPSLGTSFVSVNDSIPGSLTVQDYMSSAQSLSVKSTSGSDTSGGTGVQQILVGGLNSSGTRYSVSVTLTGAAEVPNIGTFLQVDAMFALSTGSNTGAVGTITLYNGANIYGVIQPGSNAWRSGKFYTDNTAAAYVDAWNFGSVGDIVRAQLRTSVQTSSYGSFITRAAVIVSNSTNQLVFPVPIRIPKNMAGMIRATSKNGAASNEVTTSFELHFITE